MPGDVEQRTEAPTPRRREEARRRGQVARSSDLTAACVFLIGVVVLRLFGPRLWVGMQAMLSEAMDLGLPGESMNYLGILARSEHWLWTVAIVIGAMTAAVAIALLAQVGWLFTFAPITPSLAKINPINGFARLFAVRSLGNAVISCVKVGVVAFVACWTLFGYRGLVLTSGALNLHSYVAACGLVVFDLCMRLAIAVLVIALVDVAWQRFRHERDLRMTKEEVRDELRSMEGDPGIKRRRRQIQLQMMMRRLRRDVPKADVVVTNPTHYAVAIQYVAETMSAPKVVAKGVDYAAIRIRQLASQFGIPIVERRPLARALYESVQVGQYIPERFYRAIAEILAYVYELKGKSIFRQQEQPTEVA